MGFHGGGWWAFLSHDEKQEQPAMTRSLLLRVWEFARPYRWKVIGLLLTIFLISGLSLIPPLLFRNLIDEALPERDFRQLNLLALALIAIPLFNGLIGVIQRRFSAEVGEGVIFDLRRELYAHMQHMSLRFFTKTRTGELMSRLNNDVVGAQRAVTGTLISIVSNIVSLVSILIIMFFLEWRLTLLGLIILPLFGIPARRVARILRKIRRESMILNAEMNATMNETLNVGGALLVKIFGRQPSEIERFTKDAAEVRDIGVRSAVISQWFFLALGVVTAIGTALVYWAGGYMVLEGSLTIGTIVAFSAYLTRLYTPLISLTNAPVELAQSLVSFERVFEALDIPLEITEKETAKDIPHASGSIEFRDVSFSYSGDSDSDQAHLTEVARMGWGADRTALIRRGKEKNLKDDVSVNDASFIDLEEEIEEKNSDARNQLALKNINFTMEPGELVALVGPSGAGKTTITYLIPRLYDPTAGKVLLDDVDLRELKLSTLPANIGMVTQDTYLFYDTIRANLLYAREDATREQLVEATKAANLYEFILSLPDGFDTVVGERGYRLSGGERQRIAIARVILKDPRILVLDEATSHLDSLSEALIQEALQRLMQGRTSLVIAHRLSTILAADKILVMDKGKLVESGTHNELLVKGGLYTSLFNTQFGVAGKEEEQDSSDGYSVELIG